VQREATVRSVSATPLGAGESDARLLPDLGMKTAKSSCPSVVHAGLRCLWISRYMPYPLDAGAKVYSAKLAESLAASGVKVRYMGIGAGNTIPADRAPVEWRPIPHGRRSSVAALFSPLPNAAAIDASGAYKRALEVELEEDWDSIVLDGYGTGWALERCMRYRATRGVGRTQLIHVSHNHEEKLWHSMARDSRASPLRKLALWQNYRKVRRLERRMVRAVDLLTTITQEDQESLGKGLGAERALTLTPGYEGSIANERQIDVNTPRRVILMGSFQWVVKQENLERFVELADPAFSRSGVELHVVGDVPPELLERLRRRCRATRFHGFVDEVAELFVSSRMAVVPEAIGGGFKLKFLDYFFARVPVATLSQAAAGLPQGLREQTIACDSLPALVDSIVSNIDRFDELNRLQRGAFALSRARFTWSERAFILREAIMSQRHG
jgi:glycosyltransferase involved in cell wall biosynthesis